jgi:hypothetical protein
MPAAWPDNLPVGIVSAPCPADQSAAALDTSWSNHLPQHRDAGLELLPTVGRISLDFFQRMGQGGQENG